ncbi:hypothetical protein HBI25_227040 [Parastagonospora nodorum]|nr:hypothetical protein HBH53_223580 [Parastagonospora nodorum]KAH4085908.1 hypothetical protein HBH46_208140 [Parastagonospora nodorum]KAH4189528.1 hypothetical protein HBI95_223310 [Parastagonospora nodorum]KAH5457417.1 hypothetical protein HBI31_233100 [Parastagonospora nodorum]KAH5485415.1 hypothetical protein HBI29_231980 [Parastagonospora nodorum]
MECMLFQCLEVHGHRGAGSQLRRMKQLDVVPVLCLIASGSGTPRPPRKRRTGYVGHQAMSHDVELKLFLQQHDRTALLLYAPRGSALGRVMNLGCTTTREATHSIGGVR